MNGLQMVVEIIWIRQHETIRFSISDRSAWDFTRVSTQ